MESSRIEKISRWLDNRNFTFSGVLLHPLSNKLLIFYPENTLADKIQPGFTSLRQMSFLRNKIWREFQINIEFISIRSSSLDELEPVLITLINQKYPELVSECSISFPTSRSVDLWLTPKSVSSLIQEPILRQLELELAPHLLPFGLKLNKIQGLGNSISHPSPISILRHLKVVQPSTPEKLFQVLVSKEFDLPNIKWLSRQLDRLRKDGLIVRSKSNSYALTLEGLKTVPEASRRNSSDILRVLALGGRRWL